MFDEQNIGYAGSQDQVTPFGGAGVLGDRGLLSSPATEHARAWTKAHDDLFAIQALPDNWDYEGAKAPDGRLVESTFHLLLRLRSQRQAPPSRIAPSTDGTILVEWQARNHYFEFEVVSPYRAEAMFQEGDRPAQHWEQDWAYVSRYEYS